MGLIPAPRQLRIGDRNVTPGNEATREDQSGCPVRRLRRISHNLLSLDSLLAHFLLQEPDDVDMRV